MAKKQGGKNAPKKEEGAEEAQVQSQASNPKEKSKLLSKIYREYSRRKFTKYKQQFPRLKESELIAKIIREWEAMSEGEKLSFEKSFLETGGAAFLKDDSGSKSKSKSKSKSNSDEAKKVAKVKKEGGKKKNTKKDKPPSPTVRVFIEKDKPADFDKSKKYLDDSDEHHKKKEENSGSSSVEIAVDGGKLKKVKKIQKVSSEKQKSKAQQEYLTFFKYYHSRLEAEHPRWTNTQITSIIRLLWKKKNIKGKKSEKGYNRLNLSLRPVSGRRLYRREKESSGFLLDQINQMWKALPFESKKYWERKGRGGKAAFSKVPILAMRSLKRTLKSGSEGTVTKQSDNFKWMNSRIQQS